MRFLASHRIVVWLVVLLGSVALNGRSSVYAAPVCALVDSTKDPAIALLETQLLADPNTTWVERTEINRVLAEQELQTAFAAEGIGKRAALGRLLKADVLVLLRPAKNPDPNGPQLIDGVVCETKRGLRLRTLTVAKDKDAETTAKSLRDLVQQGLQKHAEKVTAVVAVPPFLSEDLGLELNYLQSAFAHIVQERLLEQPGILVVELKEAQAIAKEIALTQSGAARLELTSPWYLIGRYRHDGQGAERRAKMSLRLLDGDQQVTLKGVKDLPPQELPAWITTKTGELLPLIQEGFKAVSESTPQAEARRLAERAHQFYKIGAWQEALELYEASSLLDNEQESVHRFAVTATTYVIHPLARDFGSLASTRQAFCLYQRGLEHVDAYVRLCKNVRMHVGARGVGDFVSSFAASFGPTTMGILGRKVESPLGSKTAEAASIEEIREIRQQARRLHNETFWRIAEQRAQAGIADDHIWSILAIVTLREQERYDLILQHVVKWNKLPDFPQRLFYMTFGHFNATPETPVFKAYLAELEKIDRDDIREGIKLIRAHRDLINRAFNKKIAEDQNQDTPDFETVQFSIPAAPEVRIPSTIIPSFIPLPKGEFVSFGNGLLTMEKPGVLVPIMNDFDVKKRLSSFVFDGRYIWYLQAEGPYDKKKTQLFALEFATNKLHLFVAEDGIPNYDNHNLILRLSAVSPGKICVIGYSGHTWAAIAEISPDGTRKFDVFFEAREIANSRARDAASNPNFTFNPGFVFELRQPVTNRTKILVGRMMRDISPNAGHVDRFPLILDPEQRTATVAKFDLSSSLIPTASTAHRGTVVKVELDDATTTQYGERRVNLKRIQYPGDKMETILSDCPNGIPISDSRGLHLVGKEWWFVDDETTKVRLLTSRVPWVSRGLYPSRESLGPDGPSLQFVTQITGISSSPILGPLVFTRKDPRSPDGKSLPAEFRCWRLKPELRNSLQ